MGDKKCKSLALLSRDSIPRHAYMELSKILGKNKEDDKQINAYVNISLKLQVNACYQS